jgi:hypothetical protein
VAPASGQPSRIGAVPAGGQRQQRPLVSFVVNRREHQAVRDRAHRHPERGGGLRGGVHLGVQQLDFGGGFGESGLGQRRQHLADSRVIDLLSHLCMTSQAAFSALSQRRWTTRWFRATLKLFEHAFELAWWWGGGSASPPGTAGFPRRLVNP